MLGRNWVLGLAGLTLLSVLGCGETQVTPVNRRIVESLATAVSARNADWLSENVALIEKRRSEGSLSEAEARAFQAIIDPARRGEWDEAERRAFALRDGQRASSEDREAAGTVRVRPPSRGLGRPRDPAQKTGAQLSGGRLGSLEKKSG